MFFVFIFSFYCFNFQDHLVHCEFATVPCPQCQQSVKKSHLEEHITVQCQKRPMSCPDCVACFLYEEREVPLNHFSRTDLMAELQWCFVCLWGNFPNSLLSFAPSASSATVSLCQCEVSVLWAGARQRPGESAMKKRPQVNEGLGSDDQNRNYSLV